MKKVLLGIVSIIFSCTGFCNQNNEIDFDAHTGMMYKKLYINPEKIAIFDNQIYLNKEDDMISISSLFCDEQGVHLKTPIIDSWWTCICGWQYSDKETKCVNPNCILSR